MYENNRAGLELNQAQCNSMAIHYYQQAINDGNVLAAWYLSCLYKKLNQHSLSLKFYSVASFLYKNEQQNIQHCRTQISSFNDSPEKHYALTRIHSLLEEDTAQQLAALTEFKKPSEYALFFDCDMVMLGNEPKFHETIRQLLGKLAALSVDFEAAEQVALTTLIIQYMSAQLKPNELTSLAFFPQKMTQIKELIDLLNKHELHIYRALDQDTQTALIDISSSLLAIIITEPYQYRELALSVVELIANLPLSAAIFQEPNLVRLCCSLMTQGQYTLTQINTPLSPKQLKILLMHVAQNHAGDEYSLDEDESPIDELGLALMSSYGVNLVDKNLVQQQAQKILRSFSAKSSTVLGLECLQQQSVPRLNPLLLELEELVHVKQGHVVLLQLLKLKEKLIQTPEEKYGALYTGIAHLLHDADIMYIKVQPPVESVSAASSITL